MVSQALPRIEAGQLKCVTVHAPLCVYARHHSVGSTQHLDINEGRYPSEFQFHSYLHNVANVGCSDAQPLWIYFP